ncbi:MAG: VOC family protein [Rhodothalassiaceae bacterium]
MSVKPIPDGFRSVQPFLIVSDLEAEMRFLQQALDGKPGAVIPDEAGKPRYGEIAVGDSVIMLSRADQSGQTMPAMLYLYVEDADAHHRRAIEAGATELFEIGNQPYGDRHGVVQTANGVCYCIATHVEDVSPEETARRLAERDA